MANDDDPSLLVKLGAALVAAVIGVVLVDGVTLGLLALASLLSRWNHG